ncbi:MAG: cytochrome c biogenesis protein ResB [Planctomycetota bacterium]
MRAIVKLFGSYGLACVLLLCLFMLTLFGTLYQQDNGLYDAKQIFFNSWFVSTPGGIPMFPGGVTVMLLLTINLIVGGILRIKWHARNAGVLVIHFGIIFMLVAGLVKLTKAEEGSLLLYEGQQSSEFRSSHLWEVTVWEMSDLAKPKEWSITDEFLTDLTGDRKRTFSAEGWPFELELHNFLLNSNALPKGPNWVAASAIVDNFGLLAMDAEKEHERNLAGMEVNVLGKDGSRQPGLLWAAQRAPWVFEVDNKLFAIELDRMAYPMPFEIRLEDFMKEDHPGIGMAKAYKSQVTQIMDGAERPVLIQMNEPLRDGGLVLFQSSYGPDTPGHQGPFFSVFSVVNNPSDKWPEYSLWVITAGLVMAFGRTLLNYIRKQTKRRTATGGKA